MTRDTRHVGAPADPGTARAHLCLAWDEARKGCTRMVEVDGRLEWLDIPPRAQDGQRIWFPRRGRERSDGRPGDLWVSVEVLPEPVAGPDLHAELEISPIEAATGARKIVRVEGRNVWVRVPPNVVAGHVLTVRTEGREGEHGGERGSLLVRLTVAASQRVPAPEYHSPAVAPRDGTPRDTTRIPLTPLPRRAALSWPTAVMLVVVLAAGSAALLLPNGSQLPADAQPVSAPPLPVRVARPVIPTKSSPTPRETARRAAVLESGATDKNHR